MTERRRAYTGWTNAYLPSTPRAGTAGAGK